MSGAPFNPNSAFHPIGCVCDSCNAHETEIREWQSRKIHNENLMNVRGHLKNNENRNENLYSLFGQTLSKLSVAFYILYYMIWFMVYNNPTKLVAIDDMHALFVVGLAIPGLMAWAVTVVAWGVGSVIKIMLRLPGRRKN